MASYLARRLLQALPLLLAISIIVFALLQMTPGGPLSLGEGGSNPAAAAQMEKIREQYGLNDPMPVQYLRWAGGVLTGDWGTSFKTGQPVLDVIGQRVSVTLTVSGLAFLFSTVLSLVIGAVAAVHRQSVFDYTTTGFSFIGLATPSFWFALMLVYVFSFQLGWLPASGLQDLRANPTGFAGFIDRLEHLILPVMVLSLVSVATLTRYVRSAMLDVLAQDYIRTARGSGLGERTVIIGHAMKNAAIPVTTVVLLSIPEIFLGAVITETIFGLPGMGRLFIESANERDYPVLLGLLMIAALLVVIANIVADLVYARLDPRISYA
ncbi:ABC transporter permease [Leucobacter sp. UT-8R-CII-1-4]|uniref:ABC transporter permease n=1 Tax=Leucobacter sp. UT-8R-CII-1-4 TaxID=3040075 RepID=UPI0024A90BA2|nr:ABC transporter permease [Leucobacter sp. UT-8R-CII-1-4]MDI6022176.1 ABC transporter permease [Leucobacter sp. UT-8R-CII-1-4]